MSPSWRTTVGGIIIAFGLTLSGIQDPNWMHWVGVIVGAIGSLILGSNARDNKVTSEEAGAPGVTWDIASKGGLRAGIILFLSLAILSSPVQAQDYDAAAALAVQQALSSARSERSLDQIRQELTALRGDLNQLASIMQKQREEAVVIGRCGKPNCKCGCATTGRCTCPPTGTEIPTSSDRYGTPTAQEQPKPTPSYYAPPKAADPDDFVQRGWQPPAPGTGQVGLAAGWTETSYNGKKCLLHGASGYCYDPETKLCKHPDGWTYDPRTRVVTRDEQPAVQPSQVYRQPVQYQPTYSYVQPLYTPSYSYSQAYSPSSSGGSFGGFSGYSGGFGGSIGSRTSSGSCGAGG